VCLSGFRPKFAHGMGGRSRRSRLKMLLKSSGSHCVVEMQVQRISSRVVLSSMDLSCERRSHRRPGHSCSRNVEDDQSSERRRAQTAGGELVVREH